MSRGENEAQGVPMPGFSTPHAWTVRTPPDRNAEPKEEGDAPETTAYWFLFQIDAKPKAD